MRIIDGDALREEVEFHVTSVSVCGTAAEATGMTRFKRICIEDIDKMPTIDAIPVEWMEAQDNIAVKATLAIWQKEQEAR